MKETESNQSSQDLAVTADNGANNDNAVVVAIGASAGGLEALKGFFNNVPNDCRYSFVIIQHLSPDHKSMMAELLSGTTQLFIREVKDNMEVQPGYVYLIPPRNNMTIENNRLALTDKPRGHGLNLPIDIFFRSLAKEKGERAIGIILSGTGSDGTRGIRAIKEEGGMVMVQSPQQAAFDGMPQNAISTGLVDFILPVEQLPEELLNFINHPKINSSFEKSISQDEETLSRLLNHVNTITSLDFNNYKRPTLARRIVRRMGVNKCDTLQQYIELLSSHPQEVKILSREFLIGVTKFFRDGYVWEVMENQILPELIRAKIAEKKPLKVWSVACSSGEEVYSLAMLIVQELKRQKQQLEVKIFATDIMKDFLDVASKGVYPESIVADVSQQRLQEFFIHQGDEYQVKESLRRMVIFSNHNILKDPPFNRMDLVICRNLLIYIEPKMQQRIMHTLHYALNLDGVLLLGTSETVGEHGVFLKEINKRGKIYRNIQMAQRLSNEPWGNPERGLIKPYTNRHPRKISMEHRMSMEMNKTLADQLEMACVYLDQQFEIIHAVGNTNRYLQLPDEGFSTNLLKMLPEKAATMVSIALRKVMSHKEQTLCKEIIFSDGKVKRSVDILIRPLIMSDIADRPYILVLFIPHQVQESTIAVMPEILDQAQNAYLHRRIEELEIELSEAHSNLQTTVEEMETSNEELQAMNEELLAANEELQSTNEELQSVNEELHTVNAEYQSKLEEVSTLNAEMDNLLKSTDIGTLFLDREMNIRRFTPALREQFNLRSSDLERPLSHFTSNFDAAVNQEILAYAQQVLKYGVMHQQEVCTNKGKWYLERITPYHDLSGAIDGVVISFIDINTLKQTEAALEKSQQRYRTLYDHTPDMLLTIDSHNRTIMYCNQTLAKKLGYERKEDLIGRSAFDVYHPEHLSEVESVFKEYMKTGLAVNKELVIRTKHGEKRIIMANVTAQRDDDGEILYSNSVWRDITELKKTEQALRLSESLFRSLFEQSPLGMVQIIQGSEGVMERVNPSFCAMLGYTKEELQNKTVRNYIHPDDYRANQSQRERLKSGEIDSFNAEIRYIRKDRSFVWVHHTVALIRMDGEPSRFILLVEDITDRKQAEDELEQRNEDLKQFAYIASHDLQEPLRTISSFSELLAEDYKDKLDQTGQDFVGFILSASEQMNRLLSALLDYSRLGNNEKLTDIDLQVLLKSIQNELASTIAESKAIIEVGPLPTLSGYETEFRIVFQNLLSNALKFQQKDRRLKVRIAAERQNRQWQFVVQDNGIGIAKEHQERIFAIFQRLHPANEYEGTGIGLAYCKKIVELRGGRIWVESQPGIGSSFYFTIADDSLVSSHSSGTGVDGKAQ